MTLFIIIITHNWVGVEAYATAYNQHWPSEHTTVWSHTHTHKPIPAVICLRLRRRDALEEINHNAATGLSMKPWGRFPLYAVTHTHTICQNNAKHPTSPQLGSETVCPLLSLHAKLTPNNPALNYVQWDVRTDHFEGTRSLALSVNFKCQVEFNSVKAKPTSQKC